jgi:hypothetical protein
VKLLQCLSEYKQNIFSYLRKNYEDNNNCTRADVCIVASWTVYLISELYEPRFYGSRECYICNAIFWWKCKPSGNISFVP